MIKLLLKYDANPHAQNDVPIKIANNMEDIDKKIEKLNEENGKIYKSLTRAV